MIGAACPQWPSSMRAPPIPRFWCLGWTLSGARGSESNVLAADLMSIRQNNDLTFSSHRWYQPSAVSSTIIRAKPIMPPAVAAPACPCACDSGMTSRITTKIIEPAANDKA